MQQQKRRINVEKTTNNANRVRKNFIILPFFAASFISVDGQGPERRERKMPASFKLLHTCLYL